MSADKVQPYEAPTEADENYNGDQKDMKRLDIKGDELQNGPVLNRSCTDPICCLIFVAFIAGMGATAAYGFANGQPKLLLTTWDADGRGCGYSPETKDFPYLYWPAPNLNFNTSSKNPGDYMAIFKYSTCVRTCPNADNRTQVDCNQPKLFNTDAPNKFFECTYYPAGGFVPGNRGPGFRYNTTLSLGKYCLPDPQFLLNETKPFIEKFNKDYNVDKYTDYITDLVRAWYVMAISIGVAVVTAIIYLLILRCCAGVMIWLSIIGILGAMGGGGYWLFATKDTYPTDDPTYMYMQYGAYALWGIGGAFLLTALCCCSRIQLAVAIMKVTSSFIYRTPTIILLPIIFLVLICAWIIGWTFLAIWIMSVGEPKARPAPLQFLTTVEWNEQTRYIFLYHLFGGLWVNAFLIGCFQFIVAAACAIWYFSHTSDTAGSGSICQGIKWILRYHLGSIAFGSFIIAVVEFIRIVFEYYRQKIQAANKDNKIIKVLLCCTSYLLACLDRCIKFITKNAYIQIALSNKNFCASAWNAFLLIVKNAMRFGAVTSVGGIFMFLGRLFIICVTAVVCYVQMTQWPEVKQKVSSPYFPTIVAGIIGFLIGGIFMSVFSFASDTILQCFLLDEELGAQGKGRPPGNRPPLMNDFIDKATAQNAKK